MLAAGAAAEVAWWLGGLSLLQRATTHVTAVASSQDPQQIVHKHLQLQFQGFL